MKNWRKNDPHYQQEKSKYPHPVPSRKFIIKTFTTLGKSLSFAALAKAYNLNRGEKETLKHRIKAMLRDGQLEERANGKLRLAKPQQPLTGKIFAHAEGYGFFIPDDKTLSSGEDLYLSNREMRQVMHGDTVEAIVLKNQRNGKKSGKIVRVLEHASKKIIGRLIDDFGIKIVKAENRRIQHKILLTNADEFEVTENQVVEVSIVEYPTSERPIVGKISKVMGDEVDTNMEIDIALNNFDLPHEWSQAVIQQTVAIADELSEKDYKNRVDLRELPLVTIDGITARDFDDAVCAKPTKNGYKLYIAIADVAHYVGKDSPLDSEAVNRATSVYFPNRVIPMLPEKLSNGLCSLNPKVDRLCLVCEILIDMSGEITRSKFYEAVMHSHARLTYESVEDMLFTENTALNKDYAKLLPHLQHLKDAYLLLRRQRQQRGAIDFHTTEAEFEFAADGQIERIIAKESLQSHQLIEEFMVRANVCAAKFLLKQKGKHKPIALFRNHLGPSQEKLATLIAALKQAGIAVKLTQADEITPKQLAAVVEQMQDHDDFAALQMQVLRSMHQAVYQPDNHGHFGLALGYYAHFTSPIRRYPDLLVHRAIKHYLNYKKELYIYSPEQMQQLGEHCSMAERRADEAVYDIIAYLKCQYMADKLGQEFAATISTVTGFGFFTTLDGQFIDGLVHISSLDGDYFNFDETRRVLVGENSRKVYSVGDKVTVIVSNVSIAERRIDFILNESDLPFAGKKQTGKRKRRPRN